MVETTTIGFTTILTLPSGLKVRAHRPSVFTLIASGGFPAELTEIVYEMTANPVKPEEMVRDPEKLRQFALLIDAFVPHVLVDPRVGPLSQNAPGEDGVLTGTVSLIDMNDMDKLHLFLYGQGLIEGPVSEGGGTGSTTLKSFRENESGVDVGRGGEAVRDTALASVGDGPA